MDGLQTSWHSHPKIYALGHAALTELLLDPVVVEEKIDGSQFSFGKYRDENDNLILKVRSKGVQMNPDAPEKMFKKAVDTARDRFDILIEGWCYRGEFLAAPKHNTLAYDRTPKDHVILFDICTGEESYLRPEQKAIEAKRIGLECVPWYGSVDGLTLDQCRAQLDQVSVLGGQKVEGIVVKNYNRFGRDKKVLMGKFVSEAFKEVHGADWKERNPNHGDIIMLLAEKYKTPARWAKAAQHLRETGALETSLRDIPKLIKETRADISAECREEIAEALMRWAMPQIERLTTHGLPEWWKEELMRAQFNAPDRPVVE